MINPIRHFLYRFKYRFGRSLPLNVPVDVSLELSSECSMKCVYCYHGDAANLPFTKGMMDRDTIDKILLQAHELGVNSLKFNYRGESTISPHFYYATNLAKRLAGGSTFIDRLTNSNFKFNSSKEEIFLGLANQTKVKVSFDSFRKEVFETQRAGGIHELTQRNIDIFYNHPARIKSETRLVIQAVRTTLNKDEDLEGQVNRRWPEARVSIRDMVGGRTEKDTSSLEAKKRDPLARQSCVQAHVRLIFHWDGRCSPCCPSIKNDLIIGDINKDHLHSIFNGPVVKKLREELKSKRAFDRDPCKTCSSHESYGGFRPVWNS